MTAPGLRVIMTAELNQKKKKKKKKKGWDVFYLSAGVRALELHTRLVELLDLVFLVDKK